MPRPGVRSGWTGTRAGRSAGRGGARRVWCAALLCAGLTALSACSDEGEPAGAAESAASTGTPSAPQPTPTPSSSPPSASPSASVSLSPRAAVTGWFTSGGEDQLVDVMGVAADVQARHERDALIIDFTGLFDTVHAAQKYAPIPDRATQTAWKTALQHLSSGAGDVYNASALGRGTEDDPKSREQIDHGWKEFGEGVKGLKALQTRLHRQFGLDLRTDPWADPT
ncbi:hypothetical protein [Streptomyces griseosporeus]|uniref:hypothetical protein n=1 Tax=Streptomyces griseosporeus TaxID=1910 RepID=UPI003796D30C